MADPARVGSNPGGADPDHASADPVAATGIAEEAGDEPRRLTRQGQDRKAELLAHAEALFAERGYADTRMVDIAEAAGVAKGLFYWYFASKEALFSEIILDLRDRLRRAQIAALSPDDTLLEQLYDGTVASVEFIGTNARLYGLVAAVSRGTSLAGDATRSTSDHARDTGTMLAQGQKHGLVRADDDPVALAHSNAGVVGNTVSAWSSGLLGTTDLTEAAHLAARYVVYAVAASSDLAAEVCDGRRSPAAKVDVRRKR